MKKKVAKKRRQRKRKIRHRLDNRSQPHPLGPMLNPGAIDYELSDRTRGLLDGGRGAMPLLVKRLERDEAINQRLPLFKWHHPYLESDPVLNIAYHILCHGECLADIERLRNDEVYLDAVGADRRPDPTTAGDFCRRFSAEQVEALPDAINEIRFKVWKQQGPEFFAEAIIDADGTIAPTTGECQEGMDLSYNGFWGYHPLVVSLSNTGYVSPGIGLKQSLVVNRSISKSGLLSSGATKTFDCNRNRWLSLRINRSNVINPTESSSGERICR